MIEITPDTCIDRRTRRVSVKDPGRIIVLHQPFPATAEVIAGLAWRRRGERFDLKRRGEFSDVVQKGERAEAGDLLLRQGLRSCAIRFGSECGKIEQRHDSGRDIRTMVCKMMKRFKWKVGFSPRMHFINFISNCSTVS
nr:hypothetical protein [Roseobacter sp. TSBP12]